MAGVTAQRAAIAGTVAFVHAHPELAHEEHRCVAHLAGRLGDAGLQVEPGVAGLGTAFRAVLRGGRAGRRVGIVALYDAVAAIREDGSPEAVHSCGHGLIAGAVAGAALALAPLRERLAGEFHVLGCPADEIHAPGTAGRGGGKQLMAAAGVWDGYDAVLYVHPEFIDTVWQASLWMRRDTFTVAGTRSLREDVAQPPVEAIPALLRAAAGLPRSQLMIERLVLDGDVEEGAGLVLTGSLLFFAGEAAGIERTARAVRSALPGAAWRAGRPVPGLRPDAMVTAAVAGAFAAAGRGFETDPPPLPFATDFASISHRAPAALVGVGRPEGWAFHTSPGAAQFASPAGVDVAADMATVLALAAVRLGEPCEALLIAARHEVRADRLGQQARGRERGQRVPQVEFEACPRLAPEVPRRIRRRAQVADELADLPHVGHRELVLGDLREPGFDQDGLARRLGLAGVSAGSRVVAGPAGPGQPALVHLRGRRQPGFAGRSQPGRVGAQVDEVPAAAQPPGAVPRDQRPVQPVEGAPRGHQAEVVFRQVRVFRPADQPVDAADATVERVLPGHRDHLRLGVDRPYPGDPVGQRE